MPRDCVVAQPVDQRCWFHQQANVLTAAPKSAHPGALAALKDIYNAEDIDKARVAAKAFELDYAAKYPKAAAKITDDLDTLLEFYKYPAEHWIHLRTTNPIESTFGTVRLRQRVTKGPESRAAGIAMTCKLVEAAQARCRKVNAPELVALVRAGALFHKCKLLDSDHRHHATPDAPADETAGSEVTCNHQPTVLDNSSELIATPIARLGVNTFGASQRVDVRNLDRQCDGVTHSGLGHACDVAGLTDRRVARAASQHARGSPVHRQRRLRARLLHAFPSLPAQISSPT